jgi:hypothetical protein
MPLDTTQQMDRALAKLVSQLEVDSSDDDEFLSSLPPGKQAAAASKFLQLMEFSWH